MSLRKRLLPPLTSALLGALMLGLLALAPAPAATADPPGPDRAKVDPIREPDAVFARSSYLCYGYRDCKDKGMGNGGYAQNNRTMYWQMYSGHNCTNYAAYRMVRSGLPNQRPWSGGGNATYWGTSMPRITNDVPRVGAVTWWRANTGPAGSAGHVGYVEQVVSKDQIIVSQDSWGGDFSWAVITRGSGNWPSGFIHFNDVPLVNKTAPVISGATKVGGTLTASAGSWKPSAVQVSYQWYADGEKLRKSKKSTIRLGEARVGQTLTVAATATKLGYPTRTVRSEPTEEIESGQIRNETAPTISGTPKVDHTLTLDTGKWSPKPDALAIRWFADGRQIDGISPQATELELTPDLVGTVITASVTATADSFSPVLATTGPTKPVEPGTFEIATPPSVVGTAALGRTLSVATGAFEPSDADVAVQWLRDGMPIADATTAAYQLTSRDLGTRVSALVTLTRAGYTTTSVESAATARLRSDPRIQVQVERVNHRVKVLVTVTAPGVEAVSGPVTLRIGRISDVVELRASGTVRGVLQGMNPGTRTLKVTYAGSDLVTPASYTREVVVR